MPSFDISATAFQTVDRKYRFQRASLYLSERPVCYHDRLSVCLSVCVSHSSIASKQLSMSWNFFTPLASLFFFLRQRFSQVWEKQPSTARRLSCVLYPRPDSGCCWPVIIHRVSKNVPPLTCYILDIHNPIRTIFGRSVTEKVGNQTMLCFPTSSL